MYINKANFFMGKTSKYSSNLIFEKVWFLFQETDKKLRQLENLFVGQWGKLIEAMVEGELVRILRERNMDVRSVLSRTYSIFEGKEYEFDLVAKNGSEI